MEASFFQELRVILVRFRLRSPGKELRHKRSASQFRYVRENDGVRIRRHPIQKIIAARGTARSVPLVKVEPSGAQQKQSRRNANPFALLHYFMCTESHSQSVILA